MNGNDGQTTGDARVDAALARFDELAESPLTAHPEIFEDVHRRLQDALAGIEEHRRPEEAPPDRAVTGGTAHRIVSAGEAHRPPTGPYGAEEAARRTGGDARPSPGVGQQDPPLDREDARPPNAGGVLPPDAEGNVGG